MQTNEATAEVFECSDGKKRVRSGECRRGMAYEWFLTNTGTTQGGGESQPARVSWDHSIGSKREILRELPASRSQQENRHHAHTSDIREFQTQVARVEEAANVPEIVPLPDTKGFAQYSFEKGFECAVGIAKSVKAQYSVDELIAHLERTLSLVKK